MISALGSKRRHDLAGGGTRTLLSNVSLGASVILALVGLGVAGYLTVVHYAHQQIACNGIGDCEYVNSSRYAEVAGVPVALMGAAAYGAMSLLAAAYLMSRSPALLQAAWGVALASFAFSMYLTGIELWVLEAICVYCVASASVMTALFATLSLALWTSGEVLVE